MILFIKHIDIEGPETLGTFFEQKGFKIQIVELQKGDSLPREWGELEAVISLGGPMNVYEEEKYPFLKDEDAFIKEIIDRGIPFIGICLGSQLLAKASGAKVCRSPEKEIGFFSIQINKKGKKDPLFSGLEDKIDVFQWHEDMSEIPPKAELLASSEGCPHQAFKVGPVAYGLQFHIEITGSTIQEWSEAYFDQNDVFRAKQRRLMLEDYQEKEKAFCQVADKMYNNFFNIMQTQMSNRL